MSAPLVTLEGNLVFEPRVFNAAKTGTLGAQLRIACDRERRDPQTGRMVKVDPVYVNVAVWAKDAEHLLESIRVGDGVLVVGDLNQRTWDDDEGVRHVDYQVDARSIAVSVKHTTAPTQRAREEADKAGVPQGQLRLAETIEEVAQEAERASQDGTRAPT